MKNKVVVTFGTFDLIHIGHIRILKRASEIARKNGNGTLIVGVSTDELNMMKKNKIPLYSQDQRCELVSSVKYVDFTFLEESLDLKPDYLIKYKADILVMGDDHVGKFDFCKQVRGLEHLDVIYLPRTESISTTETIEKILVTRV